jgi:hypothetical protein
MKLFIVTIALFFGLTVFGQNNESIKGKWKYKDVYQKENVDSTGLKMLVMFFSDMNLEFKADNAFTFSMMKKIENGEWKMLKNDKIIEIVSQNGDKREIEIISLIDNELIIKLNKAIFIMTRIEE